MSVAGRQRVWRLRLPQGHDPKRQWPLVLVLHGGGGTGRGFVKRVTGNSLTRAADRHGMVLVFPEGEHRQWCDGRTEHLKPHRRCDDLLFLVRLIDRLVRRQAVDATRVYATGISNGGMMALRLALQGEGHLAGVAPVAAQLAGQAGRKPVSLLLINGTADPLLPYEGGHIRLFRAGRSRGEVLSAVATVAVYRRLDGCAATPQRQFLPDADPGDGTRVEAVRYSPCRSGREVSLLRIDGGGHAWPGGRQYFGRHWIGP